MGVSCNRLELYEKETKELLERIWKFSKLRCKNHQYNDYCSVLIAGGKKLGMLLRRVDAAGGPGLQICHNKKGKDREASEPVLDVDGGGC